MLRNLAILALVGATLISCLCCGWNVEPVDYRPAEGLDLPVSSPEDEGVPRGLLDRAYAQASRLDTLYSMLVLKNGRLIAEAYFNKGSIEQSGPRQSITKSVTSALAGIGIDQGYISGLDVPMIDSFPELSRDIEDPRKLDIKLADLLMMRAGYPNEEEETEYLERMFFTGTYHWVEHLVDFPLLSAPGSGFHCSNLASHLLGVIVARAVGSDLQSFAQQNLFSRIGTEIADWSVDSDGYTMGCIEIHLTARDMAKFGQLYLNGGVFDGERIIPADWLDASLQRYTEGITMGGWITSRYGDFYDIGYGYQ